MKVLIADDEAHVREGIELSLDWDRYGVTEILHAENGREAIDLIRKHRPAILFCDMRMPEMDGTELLGTLREEGWETQVIVISGYDDFLYARAALLARSVDYLLKPFMKSDLEQAVERAAAAWRGRERSMRSKIESDHRLRKADLVLDENRMAALLKGEPYSAESARALLRKHGLPPDRLKIALLLPRNRGEVVDGSFAGDADLFMFSVRNILHEILRPFGPHGLWRLDGHEWLLAAAAVPRPGVSAEFRRMLETAAGTWKKTLGLDTLFGVYEGEADAESLPRAVQLARAELFGTELLPPGSAKLPDAEPPRLADREILLMSALRNGDRDYAAKIIAGFAEAVRQRGTLTLGELRRHTAEANLMLERASRAVSRRSAYDVETLLMPLWISDLDEWARQFVRRFSLLVAETAKETPVYRGIHSIREYIHAHFHQDLTLSVLAERFHLSPQHLARLFREHFGCTVNSYVTRLRMDRARSLLADSDMTVTEIAGLLGFRDENYFGRVFKKHTGLSPMQYRKKTRS